MKNKNKKWGKFRHRIAFGFLRIILYPVLRIFYHYKAKKFKLAKKQGYFILSNHQSLMDPFCLALSFNRPIYFVATDNLFTHKHLSKLIRFLVNPIPKRKAAIDATCLKTCLKVAKEGGTVGLFVEGNRCYNDFQFYIDSSISKLIKKMGLPVVFYNLKGGYGVDPRWGNKLRKGKFTGEVKSVLSVDEINALTNDELYNIVCSELKVIDSDLGLQFKSDKKAEYLERQLFVCPKCNNVQTIYSKGNKVYCSNCDLEAEYLENLHIKVNDNNIKFEKIVDWYKYQLEYIKNYNVSNNDIFIDEEVELYRSEYNKPRKLITKGTLVLNNEELKCGDYSIKMSEITSSSVIGGFKFIVSTEDSNYIVKGNERFNPIKYVLMFNVLDGPIKEKGGDKYYGLSIY